MELVTNGRILDVLKESDGVGDKQEQFDLRALCKRARKSLERE